MAAMVDQALGSMTLKPPVCKDYKRDMEKLKSRYGLGAGHRGEQTNRLGALYWLLKRLGVARLLSG